MYVSRVSLKNVRSFPRLDLDLTRRSESRVTPRLRTVLIGENGTGKTTLLRAIAVGLADAKDAGGLLAEATGQFVSEGQSEAEIVIEQSPNHGESDHRTFRTVIKSDQGQDLLHSKDPATHEPNHLICAYGIGRGIEGPEIGRPYRVVDSVYSLFQYEQTLIQTELTLRRLQDVLGDRQYRSVLTKIKKALGLEKTDTINLVKGGGVTIAGPRIGKAIPIEGWADGYRKTLAWILDLYAWAMRSGSISKTGEVEGIVLLDEIEQHLHPSMQIRLPSRIGELLPRVQIIATTHSPLVALALAPDELVVLRREGREVVAHESVRDFRNYSVEDMLADPTLFDSEVYRPDLSHKIERYRKLASIAKNERSAEQTTELEQLGSELAAQQIPEAVENPALKELQRIIEKHNL